MLKRGGQIVAGIFCLVVAAVIVAGPILLFKEQPSTVAFIAGGGFGFVGLWFLFPVGMGTMGDWLTKRVRWLHDHEEDE